ncbi:MAG: UvrB/UvrC motif-containing protein [Terracidiphilus sp.]|nr:UvrB/UvrC motif-containing protein [Terracidiphilus sp.]
MLGNKGQGVLTGMEEIGLGEARAVLKELPASPAVFALYGAEAKDEPYVGRTPNLRGRLERLLIPSDKHPKRLQLAGRVRRIAWLRTGSEFEGLLKQFCLLEELFCAERAVERMHLRAAAFVRFLGSNRYPRVVVTSRPGQREVGWSYGPFASRAAAERYVDEVLKLHLLRRCVEDLEPDPKHPGCVYSEMKKCLAPCFGGCTDERYAEEAGVVERFLETRGESRLVELRTEREAASEALEFEKAAEIHAQVSRVEGVRALAAELVRPLDEQRAVILQAAAEPGTVAVFLFEGGRLRGPGEFSTLGMRIQNEQSGSTSLFLAPMAVEAAVEGQGTGNREQGVEAPRVARGMLEARLEEVLTGLADRAGASTAAVRQGHMALVKRWYYRPEVKRVGEIFFPDAEGRWPAKGILRGIGRVAAKAMEG